MRGRGGGSCGVGRGGGVVQRGQMVGCFKPLRRRSSPRRLRLPGVTSLLRRWVDPEFGLIQNRFQQGYPHAFVGSLVRNEVSRVMLSGLGGDPACASRETSEDGSYFDVNLFPALVVAVPWSDLCRRAGSMHRVMKPFFGAR